MEVLARSVLADEGTIVVFSGEDRLTDRPLTFAVDHRSAEAIAEAIYTDGDAVVCWVEPWQVLS